MSKKARSDISHLLTGNGQHRLETLSVPKSLFKYSSINEYCLKNLKENTLTATIPTEFNDLYDSTIHTDTFLRTLNSIHQTNEMSRKMKLREIINQETMEILLQNSREIDEHLLTYLTKDFRVVSLTTNFKDIKMWSHYANNNKGICIEYDFSKITNGIFNCIYPVIYSDKPIDKTKLCYNEGKIDLVVLISIIEKAKDWEDEREWRIVFYVGDPKEKRIQLINIPKPECIFLGSKFIENYKQARQDELRLIEEFLSYVKERKIKLNLIKPQIGSFNLESVGIEPDIIEEAL